MKYYSHRSLKHGSLASVVELQNICYCCEQYSVWRNGETCTGFWWVYLRERDHLEDPGVNGRIILMLIFRKWDVGYGLDRAGSR
jgi:hypothetical protein